MIGFGQMAYSYSLNKEYAYEMEFSSHSQAILNNSQLDWDTVVDPDISSLSTAKEALGIQNTFKHFKEVPNRDTVDIVIFSCPPSVDKISILELFPNVKGIVLEKPLASSFDKASELNEYLKVREISAQVAYLRRGDNFLLSIADKGIKELIGRPMSAQIIYGNGLKNNGSHMIDLTRMLLGEVKKILFSKTFSLAGSVQDEDFNRSFILEMEDKILVSGSPIDFGYYRENSLDIWGEQGRIAFTQEGSYFQYWPVQESRFGLGFKEIDWSSPELGRTKIGSALDVLYRNLVIHLDNGEPLLSSIESAVKTENLLNEVLTFET